MKLLSTKTRDLQAQNRNLFLKYELFSGSWEGVTQYGVAVTNLFSGEHRRILALTGERARAEAFFARIWRGGVTPMTLAEVAEDFAVEPEKFLEKP